MSLLIYLIKVTACSALLFGFYWFFLRNRFHHQFNRIFLLLALVCPILFPLISIPVLPASSVTLNTFSAEESVIPMSGAANPDNDLPVARDIDRKDALFKPLALILYAGVACMLLIALLKSIFHLYSITRRYTYRQTGTLHFYNTNEPGTPFSFFKLLFWNKDISINSAAGKRIFRHEFFHISQHHSHDILFVEIINIFFWANPVFYFIRNELKAVHEFMADDFASGRDHKLEYAELIVKHSLNLNTSPQVHAFAKHYIKRRIHMLTKSSTHKSSPINRWLAFPFLLIIFALFTFAVMKPSPDSSKNSKHQISASLENSRQTLPDTSVAPWREQANMIISDFITVKEKSKSPETNPRSLTAYLPKPPASVLQDSTKKKKTNPADDPNLTFTKTEIEAAYPGGATAWKNYLQKSLQYPPTALQKKIEGMVIVQFIVDREGNVGQVQALTGPGELHTEAVRVVQNSGEWLPAIQAGKKVKAYKKLPINFKLNSAKESTSYKWSKDPAAKAHDNIKDFSPR